MSERIEKVREVVVPGERLSDEGARAGEGCYRDDGNVFSSFLGVVERDEQRGVRVRPLRGKYMPKVDDFVVGKVIEVGLTDWTVDINSPYVGRLDSRDAGIEVDPITIDLRRYFDVGDYIGAKVISFDRVTPPSLTVKERGLGKIRGGIPISIIPSRVPRVIGKKGSMISMLDKMLKTKLVVGQNGYIIIQGGTPEDVSFTISVLRKIEEEAYTYGLTDRIKELLIKRYGNQNG
ncbi:MAG: exosome complex RNA-binding protein Rrp4 [Thermoprotei archaeon]|nr:exosome complex RNA-binding protein Rrp4 [TACK group archaeon]